MGNQTTKSPFDVQILAARLKDLMRESVPKVTQKDLAATLGTAPNMVSAYMRGKSCPSLPMAVNIAQYFDVSIDYLAGLTDHRRQQVIVSAPTPTPKRGRDPWRKMAVCNSCDWRRRMGSSVRRLGRHSVHVHPRDRHLSRITADRRLLRILQKPPTLSGQRRRQR